MKSKTIRGFDADRVRIRVDNDPLDAPLGHDPIEHMFVTTYGVSEGQRSEWQWVAQLSRKKALQLGAAITAMARRMKS